MTANKLTIAIHLAEHDMAYWRASAIAKAVGVSINTLAAYLARAERTSLPDRIDQKRLTTVESLWQSGESREAIAYAVGLSSGQALERWARMKYGKTPAQLFGRKKRPPRHIQELRA